MRLPRSLRITLAALGLLALTLSVFAHGTALTVFAAASLSDALKEVGHNFEANHGGRVLFNLAGSNQLARQIKEGAPADVFFSANELEMRDLEQASLIATDTRCSFLTNRLVVIVNAKHPAPLARIHDLASPAITRIALAQTDTVPAGIYAKEYLARIDLWSAVQPKLVETENVRAALAAVATDNVDAGMVYKTDALVSKAVVVALEITPAAGPKISYPFAVLKSAPHPAAAREFAKYLRSAEALAVFKHFGFDAAR